MWKNYVICGWNGKWMVGRRIEFASFPAHVISHVNIFQRVHRLQTLLKHTYINKQSNNKTVQMWHEM